MKVDLRCGDSWELLRDLDLDSVDSIVTDPPAGIALMGMAWDRDKGGRDAWITWMHAIMAECYCVLKPGGHALIWALPRTSHWTATAVEDAGFEIRDVVMHLFGQGFPKSMDVSKAVDSVVMFGKSNPRAIKQVNLNRPGPTTLEKNIRTNGMVGRATQGESSIKRATPATSAGEDWRGWGTALKPAAEHWILARKPLAGTVAVNVLEHGTGALNIDGTRIGTTKSVPSSPKIAAASSHTVSLPGYAGGSGHDASVGRWPANVTLDEEAASVVGEPSRFFYIAKAPKSDKTANGTVENKHPTVKNTSLMRWLCRLITPPGGTVLDPFMGSGSTGVAALQEGFNFIGIEQEEQFFQIAQARLAAITSHDQERVADDSRSQAD